MRGARRILLVLCLPIALADCREPTQITLVLTTDAPCNSTQGTSITVGVLGAIETKPPVTTTATCNASTGRVGSLVVVPSGDKDDEVAIRVVTGVGQPAKSCIAPAYSGGCIVARRALRFVPHTPLTVPIDLSLNCLDVPCGTTETCVDGQCVSATIDNPDDCASGAGCVLSAPDGGTVDAGADAPADQSLDGSGGASGAGGAGGASGSGGSGGSDAATTCPTGFGECDGNLVELCETDLTQSATHCGSCARDCLGGQCVAGACSPTVFVSAPTTPSRLAIDATHLYFVDAQNIGTVHRVPLADGTQIEQIASGEAYPNTIDLDQTYVYWTNYNGDAIRRRAKAGGAPETLIATQSPVDVTLAAGKLFFLGYSANGTVNWAPVSGGSVTTLATGQAWPREVTVTQGWVYWTTVANKQDLYRVSLTGGTPELVATALNNPFAIESDGTWVYWCNAGTGKNKGSIWRVAIADNKAELIADAEDDPHGLWVDGGWVYWTSNSSGGLRRAPVDGSAAPTSISTDPGITLGVVSDATAVYWADWKYSRIYRWVK